MKRLAALLLLAACSREKAQPPALEANETNAGNAAVTQSAAPEQTSANPVAAVDPRRSAEAAAAVLRAYFRLLEQKDFVAAHRLWSATSEERSLSDDAFAASFDAYRTFHAELATPGGVQGAAGSLSVDIPVTVSGELNDGQTFRLEGPVTLRRVNDVPGATPEQLQWRIMRSALEPRRD